MTTKCQVTIQLMSTDIILVAMGGEVGLVTQVLLSYTADADILMSSQVLLCNPTNMSQQQLLQTKQTRVSHPPAFTTMHQNVTHFLQKVTVVVFLPRGLITDYKELLFICFVDKIQWCYSSSGLFYPLIMGGKPPPQAKKVGNISSSHTHCFEL